VCHIIGREGLTWSSRADDRIRRLALEPAW